MKSASRRSSLQVLILERLHEGPARTVSEIAATVGAQRPSVSRSLKTLRNDNIVERTRNGWNLTSIGQEEAKRWNQELSSVIGHIPLNIGGSVARSVPGIRALAQSMPGMRAVSKSALRTRALVDSIQNGPAAKIRASVLRKEALIDSIQNGPAAKIRASVLRKEALIDSIQNGPAAKIRASVLKKEALIDSIQNGPAAKIRASVLRKEALIDSIQNGPVTKMSTPRPPIATAYIGGMLSTIIVNSAQSQRSTAALMPETDRVASSPALDWENSRDDLKLLLTQLNVDFVDKWQGSWQALLESNPDRLSQAASSYRELIRMVLDKLAPDVEVDRLRQGSKRKMQVRQVLEGCERDFAEVMVEGLDKLYSLLSKYAHTSFRNGIAVQGALMAGDGLLLILLTGRRGYDSKDGKTRP